ncbi:MAG: FAD binding domain-containing protein, partial [Dehalococcoidia bacterium]
MIPPRFGYSAPDTLDEALSLLAQHGPDAKVLAGGQSLIPLMKLRLAAPPYLVDINRIQDLSYIREENGSLRIGALTREADIETSGLIQSKYAIIADTAAVIADPLVRNLAT